MSFVVTHLKDGCFLYSQTLTPAPTTTVTVSPRDVSAMKATYGIHATLKGLCPKIQWKHTIKFEQFGSSVQQVCTKTH